MKLQTTVNEITLSGAESTGEFKIKQSAKAFQILSSSLYKNKIKAIIRELSTNAVDSHVAANKSEVPFELHLPTDLEPYFSIRDYGIGLNHDQVNSIYTTYFESTKTNSNEYIGALGLGSKSPFSYTENFTVTAIKDNIKRIYSAFINDQGVPCVALMGQETKTCECNGVEVKFSVTDKYDYRIFKLEAEAVLQWFKTKPIITGINNFDFRKVIYKDKDIVPGISLLDKSVQGSAALMGNILYPLNNIPNAEKYFGNLTSLLQNNLLIEFDIGELDFTASREELSFIPITYESINKKLIELNNKLVSFIKEQVDLIDGDWNKAVYLVSQNTIPLYKNAIHKYVTDTKFDLVELKNYNIVKHFELDVNDIFKDYKISITVFRDTYHTVQTIKPYSVRQANHTYKEVHRIDVSKDVYFVLDDLKAGINSRARYHYTKSAKKVAGATVFCISCAESDNVKRQEIYDKFLKNLKNPPNVIKSSFLEKKPTVPKIPTASAVQSNGILVLRRNSNRYHYDSDEMFSWADTNNTVFDDKTEYYYVRLSSFNVLTKDGKPSHIDAKRLLKQLDLSGIKSLSNLMIYGVRQSQIENIQKLKNWIWIEDKISNEMKKVTEDELSVILSSKFIDNYRNKVYTNSSVAKQVGEKSAYYQYASKFSNTIKDISKIEINCTKALCVKYNRNIDNITDTLMKEQDIVKCKYPILGYLSYNLSDEDQITAVAEYIKLIDKQS